MQATAQEQNGAGEQVSAADYDPSLDRREEEHKRGLTKKDELVDIEMIEEEEEEVTAGPAGADAESGFRRSLTLNNVWPRWLGLEGLEGNFSGGSLMGGEDARLTGTESE